MITVVQFLSLFPKAKNANAIVEAIVEYAPRFGIDNNQRLIMFLAQAAHETGEFTQFEENLNYSAQGLANTWPNRYAQKNEKGQYIKVGGKNVPNALANRLNRNPQLIANHTYANRMGNGSPESGDGWKFKGRGIFQLTGKANHLAFAKDEPDVGGAVLANPMLLLEPAEATISACWFWKRNNLNRFADKDDIVGCSRAINGGLIGIEHRRSLFAKIKKELSK